MPVRRKIHYPQNCSKAGSSCYELQPWERPEPPSQGYHELVSQWLEAGVGDRKILDRLSIKFFITNMHFPYDLEPKYRHLPLLHRILADPEMTSHFPDINECRDVFDAQAYPHVKMALQPLPIDPRIYLGIAC
jgi:hypothetical protein